MENKGNQEFKIFESYKIEDLAVIKEIFKKGHYDQAFLLHIFKLLKEALSESALQFAPQGSERMDSYMAGFRNGQIDVMNFLKKLPEILDQEISRRKSEKLTLEKK